MSKTTDPGDLEKFWKAVRDSPDDFGAWTYLLAFTEHTNNIEQARKAFEEFLAKWPYCYGYWNRFADLEKRNGQPEKARAVYEKGVAATPLSLDLWLHYINFETVKLQGKTDSEDHLRQLYRRAVDCAGLDYKSDKLWDAFINWESSHSPTNALKLYDELLEIPTQHAPKHFEGVKRLISQYKPRELIGSEEFFQHHNIAFGSEEGSTMETDLSEEAAKAKTEQLLNSLTADQLRTIRNQMILHREKIFKHTMEEVDNRKKFEDNIRRPYFHVKPLEAGQLTTWREYTDYEMTAGNHKRIVFLFERCLVACAMYEEFWMKFVSYLSNRDREMTRKVYERACKIHLLNKPYIHLAWSCFEEREGDFPKAVEILDSLDKKIPNLALVKMRRINLYRRVGKNDEVKKLYTDAIKFAQTPNGATFYACKFARFLRLVLGENDSARQVLVSECEKQTSNPRLYLQLLDLELSVSGDDREQRVVAVLDKAISAMGSIEDRLLFSQRKMEFLEDFGRDVSAIFKTYDDHQTLLKEAGLSLKSRAKTLDNLVKKEANENVQPTTQQVAGK